MQQAQILKQKVLQLIPEDFDSLAVEVFRYQAVHNLVYKKYLQCLNIQVERILKIEQIPFLPIEFFKSQTVISGEEKAFFGGEGFPLSLSRCAISGYPFMRGHPATP